MRQPPGQRSEGDRLMVHYVDQAWIPAPLSSKAVEVEEGDTRNLQRRVMEQAEWIILPKAINMDCQWAVTSVDSSARHVRHVFRIKEERHESIDSRRRRVVNMQL